VDWVALLVLVGVVELNLGGSVVLFDHPWGACTSDAEVPLVSICLLVEEVGNPSLDASGFHNGNTI